MVKKCLLAGFATLLPIAITFMIIQWLFDLMTTPFVGLVENLVASTNPALMTHESLILFLSRLVVLTFLLLITFILGFLGRKFLMQYLLKGADALLSHIPFVNRIYRVSTDVTKAVFNSESKTFKRTVMIPFPNTDSHVLAFETGEIPLSLKTSYPQGDLSVFIPTAPHPISGFLVISPRTSVKQVDISVEDTFKFLLSCGAVHPGQHDHQT